MKNIKPLVPITVIVLTLLLQTCGPSSSTGEPEADTVNGLTEAPGFLHWSAAELAQRNAQLGTVIQEDGSARQTLAE